MRATALVLAAVWACTSCGRAASKGPAGNDASASPAPLGLAPSDVALPSSLSTAAVPGDPLVVVLSRTRLALDRDGATLAVPDPATWSTGFGVQYKRGSVNDYFLLPLGEALASRRAGDAGLPPVVVAADASVPYRALIEAIFTLGQEGASKIAIVVRSAAGTSVIELASPRLAARPLTREQVAQLVAQAGGSSSPSAPPPPAPSRPAAGAPSKTPGEPRALELAVVVTASGFVVSAAGQRMAPGCHDVGAAPNATVALNRGTQDFGALTACVSAIKASAPRFAGERTVTLSATAATDLQTMVSTADALRGVDAALFPEVLLGVPR